jgi:hypothetical protein
MDFVFAFNSGSAGVDIPYDAQCPKHEFFLKKLLATFNLPAKCRAVMKHIASPVRLALLFTASLALAAEAPPKPHKGSDAFERMKPLVGTWKASADTGKGPTEVAVEYRLVAAGSALKERLFPGTPHEMITMYHDRNGKLSLTHYCAMANQPAMTLKSADDRTLHLDFDKVCGINPKTERHMHSLKVTFIDADTFRQDWTHYDGGKPVEKPTSFTFKRAKS